MAPSKIISEIIWFFNFCDLDENFGQKSKFSWIFWKFPIWSRIIWKWFPDLQNMKKHDFGWSGTFRNFKISWQLKSSEKLKNWARKRRVLKKPLPKAMRFRFSIEFFFFSHGAKHSSYQFLTVWKMLSGITMWKYRNFKVSRKCGFELSNFEGLQKLLQLWKF